MTRALRALFLSILLMLAPLMAFAAPYAGFVMDARTGEVLFAENADTRLHPASLTKMMTLYIAFQAIQRGEITLDTEVTISSLAANEPPSKLGLRAGQRIKLRYLLRAAAVKSANDAATAIGEAISGSEDAFATRMNRTAAAMGMTNTTFRNAHGLTAEGHLSTARDMSVLGRHVIYDFPQYYNLFSRRTADAGVAEVRHTNSRFLDSYPGADGIKTGFTNAAGLNLTASAQRGQERIIATVFGGTSTAQRNAKVTELMDLGFNRAPSTATLQRPDVPAADAPAVAPMLLSENTGPATNGGAGKTVRVSGRVTRSLRPALRPALAAPAAVAGLSVDTDMINSVLAEAVQVAAVAPAPVVPAAPEVVTRISTSGGRHWGVNVGRFNSRYEAEKVLLRVALNEMSTLDGAVRRVTETTRGFDANFMGLTREGADLACRRLQARDQSCFMIGSEG
ncbi:D-alanyl-D-alanine carboxypeptidase [Loktanella fryxellensis]|uniref:D-alanyl-D-alanine carboxypeptidase n=1 Tax=Loktanella fryxellensis TaxID=245187 RepID=A0A1H8AV70_9RHOB|nr:D-alanyl-D-alanine carboxypeptidase [Loktanella fryxellensis]